MASDTLSLIHDYYAKKPTDLSDFIRKEAESSQQKNSSSSDSTLPKNDVDDYLSKKAKGLEITEEDRKQYVRELQIVGSKNHFQKHRPQKKEANMPVHPAEENATGNITDKVAKESSDSTASSHPAHQEDNKATSGGSVSANAHKANLGPVVDQDIGKPASRDELKARSEELNK
ncbi:hypothetical protein BU24DRAFT_420504 [Aaosphaeria arxii CBS 175.79]|uniref:Uncharacterized protein n=1 Tax=Aaosphaeria arxii CBS 175.79 TaxID=1450172 RepID=A0A6A5XX28_9PLEO|nr:uncharacterized protein BU24DRAFT_420504 [Aaosphaeria arxii CBS 175.79]KAF2017453.1 hypothetical protein BU24DRAFT_420504 [Aaosphaeria arxii CBS 175.79]